MFAVFVTTLLWVATGRWRIAAAQAGIVAAAGVAAVGAALVSHENFQTSLPYSMYEHVISFFDPAGHGNYVNNESGDLGGNNQFRLIWWRDVVEDTLATHPVMGQGFGSDLSARFLVDFDLLNDETFAARSPHSMIVTVIGRMGLLGLAAWLALSAGAAGLVWRLLKAGSPDQLGLASVVCVVWVSACFGVVLEGPMGAVAFWIVLGLASAQERELAPSGPASPQTRYSATASAEWHVAKGS
jgi:O-antigen ligase